eukprot:tig00000411_g539.t1
MAEVTRPVLVRVFSSQGQEDDRPEPRRPEEPSAHQEPSTAFDARPIGRRRAFAAASAVAAAFAAAATAATPPAEAASSALTPIGPLGQEPTIAEAILFSPAPTPTLLANMFASGVARLVAISATHPIDTVKTKVQTSCGEPRPALETLRVIVKQQGVTGLYAGLDGTMIGQVPYSAVAFGIYEFLKELLVPQLPPSLFAHILCYLGTPYPSFAHVPPVVCFFFQ